MRQVVLDTETTGLEVERGDRIVEIGCVELMERRPTGRVFHHFVNPGRPSSADALAKHGIADDFLLDKPQFVQIADEFVDFVRGAELIIHNATFDLGFLDLELETAGLVFRCSGGACAVIDTLVSARLQWPGQRNSLDALCRRLGIDNSKRELHGALLDARLLADVYLAMTAGQGSLMLLDAPARASPLRGQPHLSPGTGLIRFFAPPSDLAAHLKRLADIGRASSGA